MFQRFDRYNNEQGIRATRAYAELAQQHGYSPAQMALAFVNSKSFVTANIIGATNLEQLGENINSINIKLPKELLEKIETLHQQQPNPCP